jgi:ATPase family AAA domain-containing protein 3A/B
MWWKYSIILCSFVVAIRVCAESDNSNSHSLVLFADISLANRNESYDKIKNIAIKTYEFKYDKVPGRKQIGILAVDAHRQFPESVEVVPQHSVPGKEKNTFITLNNFPIVDKNVVFMHGLVALQELLNRFDGQLDQLRSLQSQQTQHRQLFHVIETKINASVSDRMAENRKLLESENLVRERRQELELKSRESEKDLVEEQLKNERELLEYEEILARSRLSLQEQLAKESAAASVALEKELASQREVTFSQQL